MAKRISDEERIVHYFQNADESAANVMFKVIKGTIAARFGAPKKKTRGPNKPKPLIDNQDKSDSLLS